MSKFLSAQCCSVVPFAGAIAPALDEELALEFEFSGTSDGCGLLLRRSGGLGSGRAMLLMPRSSNLPKIILPAVVYRTEVTEISTVLPIILRALSTTTMVPSSR